MPPVLLQFFLTAKTFSIGIRLRFKDLSIFNMAAFNEGVGHEPSHNIVCRGGWGILILVKYNGLSLHTNQVAAHQAGAYPDFSSMKGLGVFLLPAGWDAESIAGLPVTH